MPKTPTFTINMDERCPRCGGDGVPCLTCVNRDLKDGKFDHILHKEGTMAKVNGVPMAITGVSTKPVEGGGLHVKVTMEFLARGRTRQPLLDIMGLQEQTVEVSMVPTQTELDLK